LVPCLIAAILAQAPLSPAKSKPMASPQAAVQALVDMERDFAALAREKGSREAFLAVLADEGLLFRPRAENGKAFHRATPDDGGLLAWEPVYADLSAAQDLGFTTGPWSFTEPGDVDPKAHGHYVSVWKRVAGTWKLLLDIGVPHPKLGRTPDLALAPEALSPKAVLSRGGPRTALRSLLESEEAFAALCGDKGLAEGYRRYAAEGVRAYRAGTAPMRSQSELQVFLGLPARFGQWQVNGSGVAESGDLGWTHGLGGLRRTQGLDETPQPQSFMRVWRRRPGQPWRVVVDVAIPAPEPRPARPKSGSEP
jgi:hypothetical protein